MRIAVIVGHEKKSPGSILNIPIGIVTEYEYNTGVALNIKKMAMAYGFTAEIFFRDGCGRTGVKNHALAWKPDLIIELHFDSASDPTIHGCTVLCEETYGQSPISEKFLLMMSVLFQGRNRGVKIPNKNENGWYNVQSSVPTYLLEPFFGSNRMQAELAINKMPEYAKGILDCIKEDYDESKIS